jgi:hypothetical protein
MVTAITWTVNTTSPVGSVVQVVPIISPASTASCSIVTASVRSGSEVGQSSYYIASSTLGSALRSSVAPIEYAYQQQTGRRAEIQDSIPATSILIDVKVRAAVDSAAGECRLALNTTETFPQVAQPVQQTFSTLFDVMPEVQAPIAMGKIKTYGAWFEDDAASVEQAAIPTWTVLTYKAQANVPLVGLINHDDGYSYDDYGRFWFSVNGTVVGDRLKVSEPDDAVSITLNATFDPGINNHPKSYDVCYWGEYVDGGLWESIDGRVQTCSQVSVLKLAPSQVLSIATQLGLPLRSTVAIPVAYDHLGPYLT